MIDQNRHLYFALSLVSLQHGHEDLTTRLHKFGERMPLLLELYPFEPAALLNYYMVRLNSKTGVDARRAYFWLKQFMTDPKLEYFILQHPASGSHTLPNALYNVRESANYGAFYGEIRSLLNINPTEGQTFMEPLFKTFTVLNNLNMEPWWEDEYALTRKDIDLLTEHLRKALR